MSAKDISLKFCVDESTVLKILKTNGVSIIQSKRQKYDYLDPFSDLDSEVTAYCFGLFLTDGNVPFGKTLVRIGLAEKDSEILENISKLIAPDLRVKYRTNTAVKGGTKHKSAYLVFGGKPASDMLNLGLSPAKSLKEVVPDAYAMNRHFWRGVIDGDGYLTTRGDSNIVGLVGSNSLCESFKEFCSSIGVATNKVTESKQTSGLFIVGTTNKLDSKKLLDYLYLGCNQSLRISRKYEIYCRKYMQ